MGATQLGGLSKTLHMGTSHTAAEVLLLPSFPLLLPPLVLLLPPLLLLLLLLKMVSPFLAPVFTLSITSSQATRAPKGRGKGNKLSQMSDRDKSKFI